MSEEIYRLNEGGLLCMSEKIYRLKERGLMSENI